MTRILVVAPSWVGDTVLAQPLFRRLHERHANLVLDVLAPAHVVPLVERMPEVHRIIAHPFGHGEIKLGARLKLGRELSRTRYHQAIVLPNSLKSALVPLFAGIPLRTGFVGEMRRGVLNDARVLHKKELPLMAERFALLAELRGERLRRPLPAPCLRTDPQAVQTTLARLGLDLTKPVAVLCPGAEYGPAKRWPPEYYAALAQHLHAEGYTVWVLGAAGDRALGEIIQRGSHSTAINLCGRTTLSEAIDLLACACLVVCNDSGLMHVAAALDRPMIALYGSSSPGFTPPLSRRARVVKLDLPCSPCFKRECPLRHFRCLRELTPDRVAAEIAGMDLPASAEP